MPDLGRAIGVCRAGFRANLPLLRRNFRIVSQLRAGTLCLRFLPRCKCQGSDRAILPAYDLQEPGRDGSYLNEPPIGFDARPRTPFPGSGGAVGCLPPGAAGVFEAGAQALSSNEPVVMAVSSNGVSPKRNFNNIFILHKYRCVFFTPDTIRRRGKKVRLIQAIINSNRSHSKTDGSTINCFSVYTGLQPAPAFHFKKTGGS